MSKEQEKIEDSIKGMILHSIYQWAKTSNAFSEVENVAGAISELTDKIFDKLRLLDALNLKIPQPCQTITTAGDLIKIKYGDCNHDWVEYKQCCCFGAFNNGKKTIPTKSWNLVKDGLPTDEQDDRLVCFVYWKPDSGIVIEQYIGKWSNVKSFRKYDLENNYSHWMFLYHPQN